jgi:hypothetical protein
MLSNRHIDVIIRSAVVVHIIVVVIIVVIPDLTGGGIV